MPTSHLPPKAFSMAVRLEQHEQREQRVELRSAAMETMRLMQDFAFYFAQPNLKKEKCFFSGVLICPVMSPIDRSPRP